jgi:hypothetical protein
MQLIPHESQGQLREADGGVRDFVIVTKPESDVRSATLRRQATKFIHNRS